MRILFDVAHPAHVHFYRHMIEDLEGRGAAVAVVSRHKDVTAELLDTLGISHTPVSTAQSGGRFSQGRELARRVTSLVRIGRQFRPDLVLTRNPAGVLAAAGLRGATSVFDTDDGAAAGLHYRLGARADVITMPDALRATAPGKTRRYPSYKALAYLHPNRYRPVDVRRELDLGDTPLFVVRLVSMQASHDHGESGMDVAARSLLVDTLAARGRLFVSSEGPLPPELEKYRCPLPTDRLHDLLAAADLYVGDSQTVAAEASFLGTPTIHVSTWSRRLECLVEIEDRYGLIESFTPDRQADVLSAVDRLTIDAAATRQLWTERRQKMLDERVDLTEWYLQLIDELTTGATRVGGSHQ